jgi:hypothetical protein
MKIPSVIKRTNAAAAPKGIDSAFENHPVPSLESGSGIVDPQENGSLYYPGNGAGERVDT